MSSASKRIVITGMAVNTPLGDTLDAHLAGLLAGRSAITRWKSFDAGPSTARWRRSGWL